MCHMMSPLLLEVYVLTYVCMNNIYVHETVGVYTANTALVISDGTIMGDLYVLFRAFL